MYSLAVNLYNQNWTLLEEPIDISDDLSSQIGNIILAMTDWVNDFIRLSILIYRYSGNGKSKKLVRSKGIEPSTLLGSNQILQEFDWSLEGSRVWIRSLFWALIWSNDKRSWRMGIEGGYGEKTWQMKFELLILKFECFTMQVKCLAVPPQLSRLTTHC